MSPHHAASVSCSRFPSVSSVANAFEKQKNPGTEVPGFGGDNPQSAKRRTPENPVRVAVEPGKEKAKRPRAAAGEDPVSLAVSFHGPRHGEKDVEGRRAGRDTRPALDDLWLLRRAARRPP